PAARTREHDRPCDEPGMLERIGLGELAAGGVAGTALPARPPVRQPPGSAPGDGQEDDERDDARHARKGSDFAAARATSISGCTTMNEPIATTTQIATPPASRRSRGGAPPAGASWITALSLISIARTTAR